MNRSPLLSERKGFESYESAPCGWQAEQLRQAGNSSIVKLMLVSTTESTSRVTSMPETDKASKQGQTKVNEEGENSLSAESTDCMLHRCDGRGLNSRPSK